MKAQSWKAELYRSGETPSAESESERGWCRVWVVKKKGWLTDVREEYESTFMERRAL